MLEIQNLTKYYRGYATTHPALKKVSLTFQPGQIVGLFGENGAGKTTLMKCILKLLSYEGTITLDGKPISPKNITRISFATSEHSFFPTLAAWSHREFYAEHFPNFNCKIFDTLMEFLGLSMARTVGSFSTGQKNQFEVILAMSQGADYILMDEPFAANDMFNREEFYKVLLGILQPHQTVILSTHLLEEVEPIISRAVLLHKGEIIGDVTMDDLEESGQNLMQYVRQCFDYRGDRVLNAIRKLTDEEG